MRKITILLASLLLCIQINLNAQWIPLNSGGSQNFTSIDFVNDTIGYVGGQGIINPTLIKTIDGGTTWSNIAPNIIGNVSCVNFLTATKGFILTDVSGSYLMSTNDGGTTWNAVSGITGCGSGAKIYFKDSNNGYLYDDCLAGVYYTTDGGVTWNVHPVLTYEIQNIFFSSTNIGYASDGNNQIYKTTDGGTTWNLLTKATSKNISSLYFISDTEGYGVGYNFVVATYDGGNTWTLVNDNVGGSSITYVGGKSYIDAQYISGDNWATFKYILDNNYTGTSPVASFPSSNYGYAAGSNGALYKLNLSSFSGAYISRNSLNYIGAGGSKTLGISSTNNWTAVPSNSWVSVSPSSGTGNVSLTITTSSNSSIPRAGWVNIISGTDTAQIGIAQSSDLGNNWVGVDADINQNLNAINFVDDNIGYVGGDGIINPTMLKTTDGGATWVNLAPPIIANIDDIEFTSATKGWITTNDNNSPLWTTADGGTTWNPVSSVATGCNGINSLYFKNINEGYVLGCLGIYYTIDGGVTWNTHPDLNNIFVTAINFSSASVGYIADQSGYIYKTTNGGTNWSFLSKAASQRIQSFYFTSDTQGYALGTNFVLATSDGGVTWSIVNDQLVGKKIFNIGGVSYIDAQYRSIDNWTTFQDLTGPVSGFVTSYPSANYGYAAGIGGAIFKLNLPSVTNTLFISTETLTYVGSGGSRTVNLSATGNWTASTLDNRFTVSPASGNGNAVLTVTASPNNTALYDTASITISSGGNSAIIILNQSTDAGADWIGLDVNIVKGMSFNAISFPSDNIGYAGGSGILKPTLIKTIDGGNSWVDIAPPIIGNVSEVKFTSLTTGFIVTDDSNNVLMKTVDGGANWTTVTGAPMVNTGTPCGKLYFKNASEGFLYNLCGSNIDTYYTNDGGNTWNIYSVLSFYASNIFFSSPNVGYATDDNYNLYTTIDGGTTWNMVTQISSQQISDIYFITDTEGYAIGNNFVLYTNNGGNSWSILNSSVGGNNFFNVGGTLFLDGSYASKDNWSTYQSLIGLTPYENHACYPSINYGYSVDYLGEIYKLNLNNVTGTPTPTVSASNLNFTNITSSSFTVNWTNGDGASQLVLIKQGSSVDSAPLNMNTYLADSIFGAGAEIGNGNYVLYNGSGNSVNVSGLNSNTNYFVAIYEQNGTGNTTNYLTYSALTGSQLTPGISTNILNASLGERIKILPNPTSGIAEIDFADFSNISEIKIVNTLGILVKVIPVAPSTTSVIIDNSLEKNGVYYLYFKTTNDEQFTRKLIKY
jgi:photosystem II stability/assembly factor-like uncharacterized protein